MLIFLKPPVQPDQTHQPKSYEQQNRRFRDCPCRNHSITNLGQIRKNRVPCDRNNPSSLTLIKTQDFVESVKMHRGNSDESCCHIFFCRTPLFSGTFWVDSNSFLRTEQRVPASSQRGQNSEAKPQDLFGQVVKDILLPKQESAGSDRSEIFTQLQIGKAFAFKVDLQVLSDQPGQSFELGLYQSQDRSTGYALRYVLQQDQSLALIRTSRSGSSVIDIDTPKRKSPRR